MKSRINGLWVDIRPLEDKIIWFITLPGSSKKAIGYTDSLIYSEVIEAIKIEVKGLLKSEYDDMVARDNIEDLDRFTYLRHTLLNS